MSEPTKWLETWIGQSDNPHFNDSDKVNGWLGAELSLANSGEYYMLTVTHETDGGIRPNVVTIEQYRVTRISEP